MKIVIKIEDGMDWRKIEINKEELDKEGIVKGYDSLGWKFIAEIK